MSGTTDARTGFAARVIAGRPWLALVPFVAATLGFGLLAGSATETGDSSWYVTLDKPATTPPDWVFPVAWTLIYILMGIAAWRLWRVTGWRDGAFPLTLFAVQFAANLAWTPVFFGLQSLVGGAVWILVVDALALATAILFWRRDRLAGVLLVPYLAWLAWASMVAWQTLVLNA